MQIQWSSITTTSRTCLLMKFQKLITKRLTEYSNSLKISKVWEENQQQILLNFLTKSTLNLQNAWTKSFLISTWRIEDQSSLQEVSNFLQSRKRSSLLTMAWFQFLSMTGQLLFTISVQIPWFLTVKSYLLSMRLRRNAMMFWWETFIILTSQRH